MSDLVLPEPFFAVSWSDYQAKLALLEEVPLKRARSLADDLLYQGLVGGIIRAFEEEPHMEAISFTEDGTRDARLTGFRAHMAQGHEATGQGNDLEQWICHLSENEDIGPYLSDCTFTREFLFEQLDPLLTEFGQDWNLDAFFLAVYTDLGQADVWLHREQRLAEHAHPDTAIERVYQCFRGRPGWHEALKAAPNELWKAQRLAIDEQGQWRSLTAWEAGIACVLRHDAAFSIREREWLARTLSQGQGKLFLKLVGPHPVLNKQDDDNQWMLDRAGLAWFANNRFTSGTHRSDWDYADRSEGSEAFLTWAGGLSANRMDGWGLKNCAELGWAFQEPHSQVPRSVWAHATQFVDRLWFTWWQGPREEDKLTMDNFPNFISAMTQCGGKPECMRTWSHPDPDRNIPAMLDRQIAPSVPELALAFALGTLVVENNPNEIPVANRWIQAQLAKGVRLPARVWEADVRRWLQGRGLLPETRSQLVARLPAELIHLAASPTDV